MFYLSGRGNLSRNSESSNEDEFGWYLGDGEIIEEKIYEKSFRSSRAVGFDETKSRSLKPTISIFTCNDANDKESANYSVSSDIPNEKKADKCLEKNDEIEMNSFDRRSSFKAQEIDLEMIENDATCDLFTSPIKSTGETDNFLGSDKPTVPNESRGFCYTPERLVRTQAYRILTPSPRYLSIPRHTVNGLEETSSRKFRGHRRKIGDLIDAKQFGKVSFALSNSKKKKIIATKYYFPSVDHFYRCFSFCFVVQARG